MFSVRPQLLIGVATIVGVNAFCFGLRAQGDLDTREGTKAPRSRTATAAQAKPSHRTATIHWQRVPLRDALGRLHDLFDDTVFVDRRVDPNMRVSLDIEAASAGEVVAGIAAAGRDLGVSRLPKLVYLGPSIAADQLRAITAARSQEVAKLPAESRGALTKKQPTDWARLGEPRRVIASVAELRGWRVANAEAIPHDLWSAGVLPELSLADQLTVLLIGFDLTFELRPNDRSIEIVPLKGVVKPSGASATTKRSVAPQTATRAKKDVKQLYTLRVQEQPVGAVLQQLSKRLHWAIQIDEDAIKAAGKSLDKRVSFSVENADQEHLLEALLRPAGLDYQLVAEQVRIVAGRYDEK